MRVTVKFGNPAHSEVELEVGATADASYLKYVIVTDPRSPWHGRDNDVILIKDGGPRSDDINEPPPALRDEDDLEEGAAYHAILTLDQYSGGWSH